LSIAPTPRRTQVGSAEISELASITIEYPVIRANGHTRALDAQPDTITNQTSKPVWVSATARDTTDTNGTQQTPHAASSDLTKHAQESQQPVARVKNMTRIGSIIGVWLPLLDWLLGR
jgi:hypothetical protein